MYIYLKIQFSITVTVSYMHEFSQDFIVRSFTNAFEYFSNTVVCKVGAAIIDASMRLGKVIKQI